MLQPPPRPTHEQVLLLLLLEAASEHPWRLEQLLARAHFPYLRAACLRSVAAEAARNLLLFSLEFVQEMWESVVSAVAGRWRSGVCGVVVVVLIERVPAAPNSNSLYRGQQNSTQSLRGFRNPWDGMHKTLGNP